MKINRIKLVNFGSHENLEAVTDDSTIVGIIGKNGQGKSTILKAIEFAFRGMLPDKIDSWIRSGSDHSIVEVDFTYAGKKGEIVRRFGKSPRRYLKYGDVEVTRASDIDSTLEEIFAIDKKVLENAVFINQGEIHKLLFGSQAEREALFVKMLNLSFCDTIAQRIDSKSKDLLKNVPDLSSQEVEIGEERKQAIITKENLERELRKLPDYSETINALNELNSLRKQQEQYEKLYDENESELDQVKVSIKEILSNYNNTDPVEYYSSKQTELNQLKQKLNQLIRIESASKSVDKLELEISTSEKELEELKNYFESNKDRYSQEQLEKEEKLLREYSEREELSKKHNFFVEELQKLKDEYEIEGSSYESHIQNLSEQIESLNKLFKTEEFDVSQLKKWYNAQSNVTCIKEHCDSCGLKLAKDQCISPEHLESLEKRIQEKEQLINTYNNALGDLTNKYNSAVEDDYTYRSETKRIGDELVRVVDEMSKLSEGDSEKQLKLVQDLRKSVTELQQCSLKMSVLVDNLKTKKSELEGYYELIENPLHKEVSNITSIESTVSSLESSLDSILKDVQSINSLVTTRDRLKSDLRKLSDNLNALSESEKLLLPKLMVVDALKTELNSDDDTLVKLELEARQKRRSELVGELRSAENYFEIVTQKWRDLQKRIKEQETKLIVANDLEQLRGLFQKEGLPINYIRLMFEKLVNRTQFILEDINSNYVVSIDNEKEVSLLFKRTDIPDSDWLSMSKMSGGERVRLTIAFLIALQELVLPDLGLLILDEPSTHLDEEWVGAVKDLITSIGKYAANTESQIWISDHNVQLIPAFNTTIQL